jgi:hypothetical protein
VKVVLDTNVIVSGLIQPLGNPAKVLTLALAGAVQVCHEKRILAEYTEVLARPRFKFDAQRVWEVACRSSVQFAVCRERGRSSNRPSSALSVGSNGAKCDVPKPGGTPHLCGSRGRPRSSQRSGQDWIQLHYHCPEDASEWESQQNWSGDFNPFSPQPLYAQSERGFNRNANSRIAIRKMQFRQNFRALANQVCNQRVRKRTVHVADTFKIQNDFIVRLHKGIYPGKTKSSRLFAVRQENPKLG